MLVLLLDVVPTAVDLPEPLLFVSLLCLPFILEQKDFKLKSSDLKLIMLKFRLTDFLAFRGVVTESSPLLLSLSPSSVAAFESGTNSSASDVLPTISRRNELLLTLFDELYTF